MANCLIQQGKPIAHGTIGSARNHRQRIGFRRHRFLVANPREMLRQAILRYTAQSEGLAAAADRDRHLAQFRCRQNESDAGWRFFQSLQKSIEGSTRQHMAFIKDKNLLPPLARAEAQRFAQFPHIIHAIIGSGVQFHHIRMTIRENRLAFRANTARVRRGATLAIHANAIQRTRNDARRGGFAHAAHARQQKSVMHAPLGKSVAQRAHQHILPDQIIEIRGPVFARQYAVAWLLHWPRHRGGCRRGRRWVAEKPRAFWRRRFGQARFFRLVIARRGKR